MANPTRLDLVNKALGLGIAHIIWKDAAYTLVQDDPEIRGVGLTPKGTRELLHAFVLANQVLTERTETRQEKLDEDPDPYWYRAIVELAGFPKGLFVELKLTDPDEEEPYITIVSAHRQQ